MRPVFAILVLPLLLLSACSTRSSHSESAPSSTTRTDTAGMACCNDTCPLDGNPVNASIAPVDVKLGQGADAKTMKVGVCSQQCADELKAHPERHQVEVWSALKDQQVAKTIKGFPNKQDVLDACCNTTCPVDGKPVDPSVPPVVWKPSYGPKNPAPKPVMIGFCSGECRAKFVKSPEKFATPEWLKQKTKQVKVRND